MTDQHQRLKEAREKAGYKTAADGARALDIKVEGYRHHENGFRGYTYKQAEVYARKFKTTPEWLMAGKARDIVDPAIRI